MSFLLLLTVKQELENKINMLPVMLMKQVKGLSLFIINGILLIKMKNNAKEGKRNS